MSLYVILSAFAGMCFSAIGIAYSLGQSRDILPMHVIAGCSAVGIVVFVARCLLQRPAAGAPGRFYAPRPVWLWGIAAGVTQYLVVRLFPVALHLGPLSPAWAAVSLGFVPVSVWAAVRFAERLSRLKAVALVSGVACVLCASQLKTDGPSAGSLVSTVLYCVLLAAMPLAGCVYSVGLKELSMSRRGDSDLVTLHKNQYLLTMYAVLLALAIADSAMLAPPTGRVGWLIGLGALAAAGSVVGNLSLAAVARGPAAVIFVAGGIAGILSAAIVSVAFLGESTTPAWFVTVGLGVLTIVLSSGRG